MEKFGAGTLSENCVFLCDDDNDIEMALSCRFAFLPDVSSESMHKLIGKNPKTLVVASSIQQSSDSNNATATNSNLLGTTKATDVILQHVLDLFFDRPSN